MIKTDYIDSRLPPSDTFYQMMDIILIMTSKSWSKWYGWR